MKVLVFDDSQIHRDAAKAQLRDHDLTVVGTYDEAQKLLTPVLDYNKSSKLLDGLLVEAGMSKDYRPKGRTDQSVEAQKFDEVQILAHEQATKYPDFDVVLTDLLVPASRQAQGSIEHVGKEMPVGIFIGLLAAAKARAKYVAVFTDSDHHSHPASACFDVFNEGETMPTPFIVNGCKVLLSNTRNWVSHYDPNNLGKALEYREYSRRSDTVRAKDWTALLAYLLQ